MPDFFWTLFCIIAFTFNNYCDKMTVYVLKKTNNQKGNYTG